MHKKAGAILLIVIVFFLGCKTNKPKVYQIAFYNVENLFDTINDPLINDMEFTPESFKNWNSDKYKLKIKNISRVISDMGNESGLEVPTIMGLSEIENRKVIEDLIHSPNLQHAKYKIVHKDSPDKRGIDVALLYNPNDFTLLQKSFFPLYIYDQQTKERIYTRDLLMVKGIIDQDTLYVLVNHWPSRYGGQERSIPSRNKAAELNRSVIDSIMLADKNAKIITMGDLNDNPTDISVDSTLNTVNQLSYIHKSELYNPMYNLYTSGKGSLYYKGKWDLFDQIIMTKSLANHSSPGIHLDSVFIFKKPYLIQQDGKFKGYLLRTFGGKNYLKGYSDHLPVYVTLKDGKE